MDYRKVTAIVRPAVLEKVEAALQAMNVPGVSVTKVKGYGEYADFFKPDWMAGYARIEVFVGRHQADETARAIMDAAHVGLEGDGIVAILPVETVYNIRTGTLCEHEMWE